MVFLVVLISACHKGKNNPEACNGNTRRELKVAIDDKISLVNFTPVFSTIDSIGTISVPEVDKETPRQNVEMQVYTVRAKVDKLKKERDGDYHIRLIDNNENYLICESANPGCSYAEQSNYLNQFKTVRDFIKVNEDHLEGQYVTITGIAFIDIDHHYARKQAKNNMELHPILEISF